MEFAVGDLVLLRVSPTKGVVRFGVSGKLSPRYIGPFTILARVGSLAYRLQLSDSMAGVHPVFHVSMLRKFLRDLDHQTNCDAAGSDLGVSSGAYLGILGACFEEEIN